MTAFQIAWFRRYVDIELVQQKSSREAVCRRISKTDEKNKVVVMAAGLAALHHLNLMMAATLHLQESVDEYARTWDGDVFTEHPVMMVYEPAELRTKRARISRARADYATSSWSVMLQNKQLQVRGSKEAKDFRNRFRVPYEFLPSLVEMGQRWFRHPQRDVAGQHTIPMELQVSLVWRSGGKMKA